LYIYGVIKVPEFIKIAYGVIKVPEFINIADLKDPNDELGRSYRDINNSMRHNIKLGQLVELDNGARLFVEKHTRDCDGTPLYTLAHDLECDDVYHGKSYGYAEYHLTEITNDNNPYK